MPQAMDWTLFVCDPKGYREKSAKKMKLKYLIPISGFVHVPYRLAIQSEFQVFLII